MIRPYLAIIKDSFRAAIASRVLVIMLILITLFLAVLVPFYVQEEIAWKLLWRNHFENPDGAVELIVENRENDDRKQLKHIWSLLPASTQEQLVAFQKYEQEKRDNPDFVQKMEFEGFGRLGLYEEFADGLNSAIQRNEFYDETIFRKELIIDTEARGFIEFGVDKLTQEQKYRLNRLLLTSAFNGRIRPAEASNADFGYMYWNWLTYPGGKLALHQLLAEQLPWILDKFVLSIGLLISILVTASIIPSMFEPGSLTLLMSKPIHRWALFIAKFIGACAFATLLSTILFLGLWLVLGFRIGYWDQSLIFSIPLYVAVFAIYYSVSAFLGMMYRNTIVSIIGTVMFWIFCFVIGITHNSFDSHHYTGHLASVNESNGSTVALDRLGSPRIWDINSETWQTTLMHEDEESTSNVMRGLSFLNIFAQHEWLPSVPGPVYNAKYDVWLRYASGSGDPQGMVSARALLRVSKPNDAGNTRIVSGLPRNTVAMFNDGNGDTIVVNGGGRFYRLIEDPMKGDEVKNLGPQPFGPSGNKKNKPAKNGNEKGDDDQQDKTEKPEVKLFEEISPARTVNVRGRNFISLNPQNNEIAVYQSKTLFVFKRNEDGTYVQDRKLDLDVEFDSTMSAWVNYAGDNIFLAFGNGQIFTIAPESLLQKKMYQPESRSAIFSTAVDKNGQTLIVLYRNGVAWQLDLADDSKMRKAKVAGQGSISAASFNDKDELMVVRESGLVTWYDLESNKQIKKLRQNRNTIQKVFDFGIRPAYIICPKPGEFYKLVTHLSSSKQTGSNLNLDLTTANEPNNPWAPFVNGFWFVVMMLALSCFVFSRTDY